MAYGTHESSKELITYSSDMCLKRLQGTPPLSQKEKIENNKHETIVSLFFVSDPSGSCVALCSLLFALCSLQTKLRR
jgi:hypothetical protein